MFTSIYLCRCGSQVSHTCTGPPFGGQRTIYGRQFSPSTVSATDWTQVVLIHTSTFTCRAISPALTCISKTVGRERGWMRQPVWPEMNSNELQTHIFPEGLDTSGASPNCPWKKQTWPLSQPWRQKWRRVLIVHVRVSKCQMKQLKQLNTDDTKVRPVDKKKTYVQLAPDYDVGCWQQRWINWVQLDNSKCT